MSELVELALLADRFAIDPLRVALEREAAHRLTLVDCPQLLDLVVATTSGLNYLPLAVFDLACARFEALPNQTHFRLSSMIASLRLEI